MSTYIVQSVYHRRLQPDELDLAIAAGRGLLIIGRDGQPRYHDRPARFKRDQLLDACASGRLFIAWASRTTCENELPEACQLAKLDPRQGGPNDEEELRPQPAGEVPAATP